MSDYLGTLAARSLDAVPVVQPRLTSWFEPVAGGSAPAATDAMTPAAAPRAIAAPPTVAAEATARRAESSVEEPFRGDERGTRLVPEAATPRAESRPRPRDEREVPSVSAAVVPPAPQPVMREAAPRLDSVFERPAPAGSSDRPPSRESSPALVAPSWREPARDLEARVAALERRAAAPMVDRSRPVDPVVVPAPVFESVPRVAAPERGERDVFGPAIADAPLPAVRVTIGRLEVRAIVPAAAAAPKASRRPSRAASIPSLDDYLRGRRGAGA